MARSFLSQWVAPNVVFWVAFGFAACTDGSNASSTTGHCPPGATGGGGSGGGTAGAAGSGGAEDDGGTAGGPIGDQPPGGTYTSGDEDNTFDHFNDPGASGQKDPFEILKERAQEGPP